MTTPNFNKFPENKQFNIFDGLIAGLRDTAQILLILAEYLEASTSYLTEVEAGVFCLGLRLAGYKIRENSLKSFLTGSGGRG